MGACLSSPEEHINQQITKQLEKNHKSSSNKINGAFILLGAKSSGKSTILHALQHNHGEEFRSTHVIPYQKSLRLIREECISTMLYLLRLVNDVESINILRSLSINEPKQRIQIAHIISDSWRKYNGFDNILSYAFLYKNEFVINDNIEHFINNIYRIMSSSNDENIINHEDIINFHITHSDVMCCRYTEAETTFSIIDCSLPVKKWDHLEQSMKCGKRHSPQTTVIYVAALSDYCETRNDNINAMQYALDEFATICTCKSFSKFRVINVFLNKDDIFRKRLRNGISLSECFDDGSWTGPNYPNYRYNDNIATVMQSLIRNMESQMGSLVPKDVVNLLVQFLGRAEFVDTVFWDPEAYFQECYEKAKKFIINAFASRGRNTAPYRITVVYNTVANHLRDIRGVMSEAQHHIMCMTF